MNENELKQLCMKYNKLRNPHDNIIDAWIVFSEKHGMYKVSYKVKKSDTEHYSFLPRQNKEEAIQMMIDDVNSAENRGKVFVIAN